MLLAISRGRTSPDPSKGDKMKWLEIIELRSLDGRSKCLDTELEKLSMQVKDKLKNGTITIYHQAMPGYDFSIHLQHDLDMTDRDGHGSPLGLRIASALMECCLVNHSVWFEIHGN